MDVKLVGEHWRDNLGGLKWSQRLRDAISETHIRDNRIRKAELDIERLESGGDLDQTICEASFVTVLDSKDRVKEVGFNDPSDMFTNNFGSFLAACFQPTLHFKMGASWAMKNLSNADRGFDRVYQTYYGSTRYNTYNSLAGGTKFQFGSGNSQPLRTNYNVQSPFATAPESGLFPTGPGYFSYGTGVVSFAGMITAGGSGTINELCLYAYWMYTQNSWDTFMLARDVLQSPITFVAGNRLVANGVVSC
jgi:hypothetical protein